MATYLQSRSAISGGASGTTQAVTYSSACTVGSLLVCGFFWNSTTAEASVSDPVNGVWRPIGTPLRGAGTLAAFSFQMFYCPVPNASATALTVTGTVTSTVTNRQLAIHEYSGGNVFLDDFQNVTAHSASGSTTVSDEPLITPRTPNSMAFACCIADTSVTSITAPYTLREDANFGANGTADAVSLTVGTSTGTVWSVSTGTDQMIVLAIFAPTRSLINPNTSATMKVVS